jgi:hypothetical protein
MINFIVTSAVNSQYGVFSPQERLQQQLVTYSNILEKFPDAHIITLDISKDSLNDAQISAIKRYSHKVVTINDEYLQQIYNNWNVDSICKNLCESYALGVFLQNEKLEDGVVVKLSGRYILDDTFSLNYVANKITLSGPVKTGNPENFSDIKFWYSVRCMIYGTELRNLMIETYKKIHQEILDHVKTGRYCDTEHALYKHMPHDFINSLRWGSMGVSGILAPYGTIIKD